MKFFILSFLLASTLVGQQLDYITQLKNQPNVPDKKYASLSAACSGAVSAGKSLVITVNWNVSTLTCAANVIFVKGGSITYTGAITLSGSLSGDLSTHFIPSGSPANPVLSGMREALYPEWFGGKGDYSLGAATGTNNCTAYQILASYGGLVKWGPGIYYSSCTLVQNKPAQYIGQGRGDACSNAITCLVFSAGTTGFINMPTARNSTIKDMWIHSLSTVAGTDNGIQIRDSWFIGDNLGISYFGHDGMYVVTDNVDDMHITNTLFNFMKGDGWHCGITTDCNVVTLQNNTAQVNGGYGFHKETGGPGTFIGNHTAGNTLGGYDMNGISDMFINNYCEAGENFNLRSNNSTFFQNLGGACTLTNYGGPSNVIFDKHFQLGSWVGPDTWPGAPIRPTYYGLRSGHFSNGYFSLWNETDSYTVFHYGPVNKLFTIPGLVALGKGVLQTNGTDGMVLYKSDSGGGGAENAYLDFHGQMGSPFAEAPYARVSSYIELNTVGAQDGSMHLKIASSGTLTDALVLKKSGAITIPGLAGGGATGACISNTGLIYRAPC
jgi:hypothetical protein